jgi:hypothetical protein
MNQRKVFVVAQANGRAKAIAVQVKERMIAIAVNAN